MVGAVDVARHQVWAFAQRGASNCGRETEGWREIGRMTRSVGTTQLLSQQLSGD